MNRKKDYSEIINNKYVGAAFIFSADADKGENFRVIDVNDAFLKVIGNSAGKEDLLSDGSVGFAEDAGRKLFFKTAHKAQKTKDAEECSCICVLKTGGKDTLFFVNRIVFIEEAGDDGVFFAQAGRDDKTAALEKKLDGQRRQIKDIEEKLKNAVETAEAADRAKTEFLSSLSVDIRTPMNAIVGFTSLAKMSIDNRDKTYEYLCRIEHSNELMMGIVNEIPDIARIESGNMNLDEERIDLKKETKKIADMLGGLANGYGVVFEYDIAGIKDNIVYTDPLRLSQITMNMISNSIKYTGEGGNVRYSVIQSGSGKDGKDIYTFTVTDDGRGMSSHFRSNFFEIFSNEKNPSMERIPGTGLGMGIIKRLVDIMGGRLSIDSKKGKGTKVDVTLELKNSPPKRTSGAKKEAGKKDNNVLEGKHILVADDQLVNRVIAKEMLKKYGVIVDEAEDGGAAVKQVLEGPKYDLVLMDVQMPVLNGYEATKKIRSSDDKDRAKIPVIAMTADAFAEDKDTAREAGMDAHISKPVNMETLLETVKGFF